MGLTGPELLWACGMIMVKQEKQIKKMKKKTHGGKRKGSGRPKKEPTTTMRIPVSKVEEVKKLIQGAY